MNALSEGDEADGPAAPMHRKQSARAVPTQNGQERVENRIRLYAIAVMNGSHART
jgi:hypothetical protein